jgi:serine/threonine protein phosphatase PrpC
MGVEPTVNPDICQSPCFDGDRFVLCSDGLSDKVAPQEILAMCQQGSPETICRRLCDLANARGGDDNITVVCLALRRTHSAVGERLRQITAKIKRLCGTPPKRTLCKGSKRCQS